MSFKKKSRQKSSTYHPPRPSWHVIAKLPFNRPLCQFSSHHCAPGSHRTQPRWKIRHLIKGASVEACCATFRSVLDTLHCGKKINNSLTSDLNLTVVITRAMTLQPSPPPSYTNHPPSSSFSSLPFPLFLHLFLQRHSSGNYTCNRGE